MADTEHYGSLGALAPAWDEGERNIDTDEIYERFFGWVADVKGVEPWPHQEEAIMDLLKHRDGLMLGICNGFQALVKLGLVPYGEIRPITESDPTLTFNTIHRHQSMLVRTRVASNKSPWLSKCDINDEHLIAISHGEGRFVCNEQLLNQLIDNGQIATQYVDLLCRPTMDMRYNPNGSVLAIEGITSPDGRVFGKMGHSERSGEQLYKNVTGDKYQPIFEGGVNYFKL